VGKVIDIKNVRPRRALSPRANLDMFFELAHENWRADLAIGQAEAQRINQGGVENPALAGHVYFANLAMPFVSEFEKLDDPNTGAAQDLLTQITASWCAAIPAPDAIETLMQTAKDSPRTRALAFAQMRCAPLLRQQRNQTLHAFQERLYAQTQSARPPQLSIVPTA